jgi:hypothetical protein
VTSVAGLPVQRPSGASFANGWAWVDAESCGLPDHVTVLRRVDLARVDDADRGVDDERRADVVKGPASMA